MNRPLRAYAEVALGRQRSPAHDTGPFMVPYLRAANVKDGYLDLTDVKEMNFTPTQQKVFSLKPGDVLVTEGSGSLSAVGASAVWDGEIDGSSAFKTLSSESDLARERTVVTSPGGVARPSEMACSRVRQQVRTSFTYLQNVCANY